MLQIGGLRRSTNPYAGGLQGSGHLVPFCLLALIVVAWCAGGVTVDVTSADEVVELLSLPALTVAMLAWCMDPGGPSRLVRAALVGALLLASMPLLQLLPVASWLWRPAAHAGLDADLVAAGMPPGAYLWTMTPLSTERSAWALLPALACFLGAATLEPRLVRRFVQLALVLVLANVAFGFFQVALPLGSPLRLQPPGTGTGFGGVLINPNHQATAQVIGLLLAIGLGADARRRARRDDAHPYLALGYAVAAALCFFTVPLSGSRAGMVIALVALALGAGLTGMVSFARLRQRRRAAIMVVALATIAVVGMASALTWMRADETSGELRHALTRETWRLGLQYSPSGSGWGSFIPLFEQAASPLFQRSHYVNHAHNEYVQWWMEGGVPALLVLAYILAVWGWLGARLLRDRRERPLGVACWLAGSMVLAHSIVDFPLRTLSLMSMTGLLAGLVVAEARVARKIRSRVPRRELTAPA